MRSKPTLALLGALVMISGCSDSYTPPSDPPMSPNTVMLSQMMRELSSRPGFDQDLVDQLQKTGSRGAALLTPQLEQDLRDHILGANWTGLDHFPGWDMRQINPTVAIAGQVAGKNAPLEDLAAVHPGASPTTAQTQASLDLGPYAIDKTDHVSFDAPSTLPPFSINGLVTDLGNYVTHGDGPNPALADEHPESQRLADVLNRLAANTLDGAQPFTATVGAQVAITPQDLIAALQASGHEVSVTDSRFFANFGHLHYKGQDVMMPFWVNTNIVIPHGHGRRLLIPVAHAEYEWHIRGPRINADVSYYFGIDGKAQWRTMDTLDQAWVLKRNAHTYRDHQAVEVTRLSSLLTVAYMHLHATHATLPFGGYYALGVCQDGVSAIEQQMTGKVTLFPNTADENLFSDPRDREINALIHTIPKDRDGTDPDPSRIFGSLPADPGVNNDFTAITIPGLAADLAATHEAWSAGTLERYRSRLKYVLLLVAILGIAAIGISINRRRNLHEF